MEHCDGGELLKVVREGRRQGAKFKRFEEPFKGFGRGLGFVQRGRVAVAACILASTTQIHAEKDIQTVWVTAIQGYLGFRKIGSLLRSSVGI